MIVMVAWEIFRSDQKSFKIAPFAIALASMIALLFDAPAPFVLLGAGIFGIFLFR